MSVKDRIITTLKSGVRHPERLMQLGEASLRPRPLRRGTQNLSLSLSLSLYLYLSLILVVTEVTSVLPVSTSTLLVSCQFLSLFQCHSQSTQAPAAGIHPTRQYILPKTQAKGAGIYIPFVLRDRCGLTDTPCSTP